MWANKNKTQMGADYSLKIRIYR